MPGKSRKQDSMLREQIEIPVGRLVQVQREGDLGAFFGVIEKSKSVKAGLRYLVCPVGVKNQEEAPKLRWHDHGKLRVVVGVRVTDAKEGEVDYVALGA